jgi:hypothetical protein
MMWYLVPDISIRSMVGECCGGKHTGLQVEGCSVHTRPGNTIYRRNIRRVAIPRDIQRLPTTPFSLVLGKEYFDCPQRASHAVHYI